MLRIKEAIVVEGRYDKNALSQVVDTLILETRGFHIFKDPAQLALLRRAAEEKLNEVMAQMSQLLKEGTENLKNSQWDISSVLKDILASGGV